MQDEQQVHPSIGRVLEHGDPVSRAVACTEEIASRLEPIEKLSTLRAVCIRDLAATGWTHRELADLTELSRARISQILRD